MADSIQFEEDILHDVIVRMPEGRAQGPSGMSSTHLRVLAKEVPTFVKSLAMLGNALINDESAIRKVPALYQYRIQCIPKHAPPD